MKCIVQNTARDIAMIFAGAIVIHATPVSAATCSMTATPIAFGQYNAVTRIAVNTTATVTVTCTGLLVAEIYTISVNSGQSGDAAARQMASGTNRLRYQIYVDAARTMIAGDGTGGTSVFSNSAAPLIGLFSASKTETVYSTILPNQAAAPGFYTDALTLIITY